MLTREQLQARPCAQCPGRDRCPGSVAGRHAQGPGAGPARRAVGRMALCERPGDLATESGEGCACVCLDFSKAFDIASHNILLEKLGVHGLDRHTVHCAKNHLYGWNKEW